MGWDLLISETRRFVSLKMLRHKVDPITFARGMVRLRKPLKLRGRRRWPKDGLYRVATSRKVHGGFLVRRGRVLRATPGSVRRYIHQWAHTAEFWGDPFAPAVTKGCGC
jgi:hypothetical protein